MFIRSNIRKLPVSASEVTTIWRYTNVYIIIIIIVTTSAYPHFTPGPRGLSHICLLLLSHQRS